jgi:hypothetical protein
VTVTGTGIGIGRFSLRLIGLQSRTLSLSVFLRVFVGFVVLGWSGQIGYEGGGWCVVCMFCGLVGFSKRGCF